MDLVVAYNPHSTAYTDMAGMRDYAITGAGDIPFCSVPSRNINSVWMHVWMPNELRNSCSVHGPLLLK